MAQGSVTPGRRRLIAVAAAAVALLSLAAPPAPAEAVSRVPAGAVKKLRKAPCPPNYAVRVSRPADPEEIQAAKQGNFEIEGVDVHIKRRMDWTFDPLGSASFRGRLHDLRFLDTLFYAYREKGDVGALKRAKRIVVDWVKNNPLREPTTDRTWFDKVAGDRGPYIAYATRAAKCEGLLKSPALNRLLLGSVQQHMNFLSRRKLYSPTNRGLFMDLGLIFSGRQVRFLPGATKARNRGERRFVGNVNDHVIPGEGMWLEHSSTYQFLTVSAIERYLEVVKGKTGLQDLLATMWDTAAWMTMPDRRKLQNGNSYQDKADRFAQKISRTQAGMRVLKQSGIAFVKTKKTYLSLLSNYHSEIHRHSDDLSFDLYEHGRRVVSDTGIPDKDFGTPYLYAISNEAHSIVEVDGGEFPRDAANAYGSGILASGEGEGWYALLATNPLVGAQGADHSRLLLYKPESALIVADRLRSAQSHNYRSYFQIGPDFGVQEEGAGQLHLFANSDRVSMFTESSDPTLQRQVIRGQEDPLLGYVWEDFRDREPRSVVTTLAEGADVDNVTTFSIDPKVKVRASAAAPLGDTSAFTLNVNGVPTQALTVIRQGDRLTVQATEIPVPPAPQRRP